MSIDYRATAPAPGGVEFVSRNFLKLVNLLFGEPEFRQQGFGARGAPLHIAGAQLRAAGYDRLMEQSFRRRHGH